MKFERNQKTKSQIPTASFGDIVFLLLIFFMVSTVFKTEDGLEVDLPRAESGVEIKRDDIRNIYVDQFGRISVDDKLVSEELAAQIMAQSYESNPMTIVAFQGDINTDYEVMDRIMEELKKVNAVRVSFNNKVESTQPKF
ncbi:MAG TPA: biopolymer transporter ExbD [Candidatus Krumholzibacteria bacterium]|nr:biopolymer transporter ExbD [Candidatus Krumholzibacteria bacterium]